MQRSSKTKRRENLYKINPYCPFCNVLMTLPNIILPNNQENHQCTIEHLSRYNKKNIETIICCYRCNNLRGAFIEMIEGTIKDKARIMGINIAIIDNPKMFIDII